MASAPFSTAARAQSQSPAGASNSGKDTERGSLDSGWRASSVVPDKETGLDEGPFNRNQVSPRKKAAQSNFSERLLLFSPVHKEARRGPGLFVFCLNALSQATARPDRTWRKRFRWA